MAYVPGSTAQVCAAPAARSMVNFAVGAPAGAAAPVDPLFGVAAGAGFCCCAQQAAPPCTRRSPSNVIPTRKAERTMVLVWPIITSNVSARIDSHVRGFPRPPAALDQLSGLAPT